MNAKRKWYPKMNEHVSEYFSQYSQGSNKGNFHNVIALQDSPDISWETINKITPNVPKGWFELSQLPVRDRIEFTLEFWLSKFPYHPHINSLTSFFAALDDIGIFIFQKKFDDSFETQMVYSLSNNRGFYRGFINATDENILDLQKLFPGIILPEDYLSFLQIHNGFCKATDCSGVISTLQMNKQYKEFQAILEKQGQVTTKSGKVVNPKTLIPFYESFGMPFYQCFWAEWHPEEIGNVYYSGSDNTISNPLTKNTGSLEQMAFPTFTDWLLFYLEQIEV